MVNLLFQVKNDDFREEIISKPYSKYVYQPVSKERKSTEKEVFLETIDQFSFDHLYGENPLKKKGHYFFCPKKSQKLQKSANLFERTFQLNQEKAVIEVQKEEDRKRERFRLKQTKM